MNSFITKFISFSVSHVPQALTHSFQQLYRVFPISHSYYLSKLLFSPDASKPSRILIGREVHSAEEYNNCIAPFRGRQQLRNALLKFSIFDETPHKLPSVAASERSQYWADHSNDSSRTLSQVPDSRPACQGSANNSSITASVPHSTR
jgi:next-to-BRCA1 protein 1